MKNYDNYINLLDTFLKQLLNKDNSEVFKILKKSIFNLYKNFKQNLFPQLLIAFLSKKRIKLLSNHLTYIYMNYFWTQPYIEFYCSKSK